MLDKLNDLLFLSILLLNIIHHCHSTFAFLNKMLTSYFTTFLAMVSHLFGLESQIQLHTCYCTLSLKLTVEVSPTFEHRKAFLAVLMYNTTGSICALSRLRMEQEFYCENKSIAKQTKHDAEIKTKHAENNKSWTNRDGAKWNEDSKRGDREEKNEYHMSMVTQPRWRAMEKSKILNIAMDFDE